jgi:hypothetical protein
VAVQFQDVKTSIETEKSRFNNQVELATRQITVNTSRYIQRVLPQVDFRTTATLPIFSVPYSRNTLFTGRDNVMTYLRDNLLLLGQPQNHQQTSCIIHGIGGIGKTQVALEFAYQHRNSFDYVFWLPAQTEPLLSQAFSKLALVLGLEVPETDQDAVASMSKVTLWLQNRKSLPIPPVNSMV